MENIMNEKSEELNDETEYLLSSEENKNRLMDSVDQIKQAKFKVRELIG